MKSYSELIQLDNFKDRFEYLKLSSKIGIATFGSERYLNQRFYNSDRWKNLRYHILSRDSARDLGLIDMGPAFTDFVIHHINPITIEDVLNDADKVWDPENLITTTGFTHRAIHYGYENPYGSEIRGNSVWEPRHKGDTKLW